MLVPKRYHTYDVLTLSTLFLFPTGLCCRLLENKLQDTDWYIGDSLGGALRINTYPQGKIGLTRKSSELQCSSQQRLQLGPQNPGVGVTTQSHPVLTQRGQIIIPLHYHQFQAVSAWKESINGSIQRRLTTGCGGLCV